MREKLEQIPFGYAFRFMYMQTNYEGEWAPREKVVVFLGWLQGVIFIGSSHKKLKHWVLTN
jgi:hypothetical protein